MKNFKFFSIWCALICAVLCVTPAHAEPSCAAIFGSALQNTSNGGQIDIGWNGRVLNDPDNQFETKHKISFNPSGLATCGSVDCTSSGSAAAPVSLPAFQYKYSSFDVTIEDWYPDIYNSYSLSFQTYRTIDTREKNGFEIRDNGAHQTYYIRNLLMGYQDKLVLQGGHDYWIDNFSSGDQLTITVEGEGTARLFIKSDLHFTDQSAVNSGGQAENLLVVAYGNVKADIQDRTSKYFLYSDGNVSLQNRTRLTGAIAAAKKIELLDSNAVVSYAAASLSNLDGGSFCSNESPPSAILISSYYFDETSWDGSSGEVTDSTGGINGTAVNGVNTTSVGKLCRGGSFDGVNDYVAIPNLSETLNDSASMAFWIKTTQSGNDTSWKAPGIAGFESVGGIDDMFWGWLDASGHIGIGTGNIYTAKSTTQVNDGSWHHVALTRNADDGAYTVYVDGVLESSGDLASGVIGTGYSSIGRVEDSAGSPIYFSGTLDELYIYDGVINAAEVRALYNDSRTCLQCFYDDFNRSSLGSDWAVSNRSTGTGTAFGNPKIVNGRLRLTDSTTYVATAASLLKLFPGAGNRIVYEFDHYAYDGNGADGMTVVLSDAAVTPIPGGYGGSLGYAQRCNINGFDGGWLGLGIDEFGNFSNDNECRGDGGSPTGRIQDSVAVRGSGSGTSGYLLHASSGRLNPGIDNPSSSSPQYGHRYRVTIDHRDNRHAYVQIERDSGSGYQAIIPTYDALAQEGQAAVPTNWLISMTGSTGASKNIHEIDNLQVCATYMEEYNSIDHYRIYHDGSGLTCRPQMVSIKACLDSKCEVTYAGEVTATLTTTPVAGTTGWQATESFLSDRDNNASFRSSTAGTVTLGVSGSGDFEADKGTRCFIGTDEQVNCNMVFYDSGFVFDVPDHVAATDQSITIAAVRKDDTSQKCVPGFQDESKALTLTPAYLNPASGTKSVSVDGTDLVSSGTTVSLDFDSLGQAEMTVAYPDVGQMSLTADYKGETGTEEEGLIMTGNDTFITRPDHFSLEISDNPAASSAAGDVFIKAGNSFPILVSARNADGDVTPNYGQEETAETVKLSTALIAPDGQHNPGLKGEFGAFGTDCDGNAAPGYACGKKFSWNEVGIIQLTPEVGDSSYLGSKNVRGNSSGNVGRFIPDRFGVSANTPAFADACLAGAYTYLGQPFGFHIGPKLTLTARGEDGSLLQNYGDKFWKYASTLSGRYYTNKATGGGAGLEIKISTPGTLTLTGEGDYDGSGTLTLTGETLAYNKPANAVEPFNANVDLVYSVSDLTDSDGVCYDETNNGSCDSFTFSGIGDTEQRYGRLQLQNAYGPETMTLNVPLQTEYFLLGGFIANVDDQCTALATVNHLQTSVDDGATSQAGNLPVAINDGTTTAALANSPLVQGNAGLSFNAPGAGNSGEFLLRSNISATYPWLLFDWNGDGTDEETSALATFGIYQGSPRLIYTRESVW